MKKPLQEWSGFSVSSGQYFPKYPGLRATLQPKLRLWLRLLGIRADFLRLSGQK
ncbi:hypothetical protein HNQ93_002217 [Hymenobacter luteus]|uniref:Uncharacterized protein n=2 Tax=Hymenobacter TaxID=89966 RepID=A0A7W9T0I9_9BACT|nr:MULTISPECIES: hypothetical protein [Hymenobacter]MBB4602214.1 hypothetical protein [Hymenobacter latericoloratus]MBB6059357.1 hypothetical protein [Hymenobacter luteus]